MNRGEEKDIENGSLWIYDNEIDWRADTCRNRRWTERAGCPASGEELAPDAKNANFLPDAKNFA